MPIAFSRREQNRQTLWRAVSFSSAALPLATFGVVALRAQQFQRRDDAVWFIVHDHNPRDAAAPRGCLRSRIGLDVGEHGPNVTGRTGQPRSSCRERLNPFPPLRRFSADYFPSFRGGGGGGGLSGASLRSGGVDTGLSRVDSLSGTCSGCGGFVGTLLSVISLSLSQ